MEDAQLDALTVELAPHFHDESERKGYWGGRRIYICGFPKPPGHTTQSPTSIDGTIDTSMPVVRVRERDKNGVAVFVERLNIHTSSVAAVEGVSGAPIVDLRTLRVIGLQSAKGPRSSSSEKYEGVDLFGSVLSPFFNAHPGLEGEVTVVLPPDPVVRHRAPRFPDSIARAGQVVRLTTRIEDTPVIRIHGEPGSGKTYLAAQLATELGGSFVTWWFDPQGLSLDAFFVRVNDSLEERGEYGFASTAGSTDLPDETKAALLLDILSNRPGLRFALFLDSFERLELPRYRTLVERFTTHGDRNRLVLIDQFRSDLGPTLSNRVRDFAVEGFSAQEVREFVARHGADNVTGWTDEDIRQVVERTGGHPMAVNLVMQSRIAGAPLDEVLTHLGEYDSRSGRELRERLLEKLRERLAPAESEALARLSVLTTAVDTSALRYLAVKGEVWRGLLSRGLLTAVGNDRVQLNTMLQQFWYGEPGSMNEWHVKAGEYYRAASASTDDSEWASVAIFQAVAQFTQAGRDDDGAAALNEFLASLYEEERVRRSVLPGLEAWLERADDAMLASHPWLLLEAGRTRSLKGSEREFEWAYALFLQRDDKFGTAAALYYLGRAMHLQGRSADAIRPLRRCLTIARQFPDERMELRVLSKIADCYLSTGKIANAEREIRTVLSLADASDDDLGEALAAYQMGKIARRQSGFSDAYAWLTKAAEGFSSIPDVYRESKALARLGVVCGYLGEMGDATTYLRRAIALKEQINDVEGLARDLDYLGDAHFALGEYDKARTAYEDSLSRKQIPGVEGLDAYGLIKSYNNLARLHLTLNDLQQARVCVDEAEALIDEANDAHAGLAGTRLLHVGTLELQSHNYHASLSALNRALLWFRYPHAVVPHMQAAILVVLSRLALATWRVDGHLPAPGIRRVGGRAHGTCHSAAVQLADQFDLAHLRVRALARSAIFHARLNRGEIAIDQLTEATRVADERRLLPAAVECLEARAVVEELLVLAGPADDKESPRKRGTAGERADASELEPINRVWRHYDEALKAALRLKSPTEVARLTLEKQLWLLTMKTLWGQETRPDDAFGLLMSSVLLAGCSGDLAKVTLRQLILESRSPMRVLRSLRSSLAGRLARRALGLIAPLGTRLGLDQQLQAMEDQAFAYLHPGPFSDVSRAIERRFPDRMTFMRDLHQHLEDALASAGIRGAIVTHRGKNVYRVYQKQVARNLTPNEVLDVVGVRIVTQREDDCYAALDVLGQFGERYEGKGVLEEPFRDYIKNPKKQTGYRSLHVNIRLNKPESRIVEFQIRTTAMHRAAEGVLESFGITSAAHWRHKDPSTYARPLPAKDYAILARGARASIIIDCDERDLSVAAEVLRSAGKLRIWGVDMGRLKTSHAEPGGQRVRLIVDAVLRVPSGAKGALGEGDPAVIFDLNKELRRLRQCTVRLGSDDDVAQARAELSAADKAELLEQFESRAGAYVYALTPRGDVKQLPRGATVLDFAYAIHTELGHHARGAQVNGAWEPLHHSLATGDWVNIITSAKSRPSRDWIQYAKSRRARTKVKQWLRRQGEL